MSVPMGCFLWNLTYSKKDRQVKHSSRSIRPGRTRRLQRTSSAGRLPFSAACAAVVSATLTAGLLGVSPAIAEEVVPPDRGMVVGFWLSGGRGVQEAAEQALLGTDEDVRKFLTDRPALQQIDDRVDVSRVLNSGGPGVRAAAKQALLGTPEDVAAFLDGGWKAPHEQDQRVDATRVVNFGGPGVQDAGNAALRGTPADVKQFLEVGQYKEQETDERVEASKLYNSGGPNVKAAAQLALRGTSADISEFLDVGQFVARNRDQEHATIAQLTAQAERAGKQAEAATDAAEEASAKAIASSALAQEAAEKAARETEAAKDDAKLASVKSKQAASAARAAAQAAQTAIGAANAASRSARRASLAAAQTANAAAAAAEAATRASDAAIAASKDKDKAQGARDRAADALAAAALAEKSAKAAEQAGKASLAAADAAVASRSAKGNADRAADAADQAAAYAEAAGGSAAEARAAAAETRRHANEANRAATAAESLARKAATAANEARDAANSAATHARNAAKAAQEAADHAGEAASQAAEATKQANIAKGAADAATKASDTAQKTFSLARETEAEELATRTNAAVEAAKSQKATADTFTVDLSETVIDGQAIVDDTKALAAEANQAGADQAAIAAKGRPVALRAMKYFGSWRKDAAVVALSGTDADVIAYLRTGWDQAVKDEMRQQVADIATASPYEAVRTAATQALAGTDEQIRDFYLTGQHQAANADYRVAVTKISNDGGPGVKEAATKALEDGSASALLAFLNSGQYEARQSDDRVISTQLFNDGGPEVKAAAKIALNAPADEVHGFVQVGQFMADRKDRLAYTHIAQVERLLAEGRKIAATARFNAWNAAKAAADANDAAEDAALAAAEAQKSADQAQGYAADADKAADSAETSAAQAKASATTARSASNRAQQDADNAQESAAEAEFSAEYARTSAYHAQESADAARTDALKAGKSAAEADGLAKAAWTEVVKKREAELAEARRLAAEQRKKQREAENQKPKCYIPMNRDHLPPCAYAAMAGDAELVFPGVDPVMKEVVWEVMGLNDAKECAKNPALGKCAVAALSILPVGKLKLLKKGLEGVEGAIDSSRAARMAQKCTQCFLAGTKVLMADNSVKNIESVEVGESVIATDPVSGKTEARAVTDLIVTDDDRIFNELTVATAQGTAKLTATHEHPFWSPSQAAWVEASDLRVGMTLRAIDGSTVTVAANRSFGKIARTYNLTVADLHTYYVLAGSTPVLVHNSRCLIADIVGPQGEKLWLPKGRKAVSTANSLKGWVYDIKATEAAANGFHKSVRYVRVMDPVTSGPHPYPNGYINYLNELGQVVHPFTGAANMAKADPYWHIRIP
ncbi:polymorphic toxin-type HINT domain-containing protein [Streptomyces sp. NPDC002990]